MEQGNLGTELITTSTKLVKRSKPTLVTVEGRKDVICTDTRFHRDLAVEYLLGHGASKWITIGDLSRVFMGRNSLDGKKRVRRGIPAVRYRLLRHGKFLLSEIGGERRQIQAVKIADLSSEYDRQAALEELQRMYQRRELSIDRYQQACQVVELNRRLAFDTSE